MFGWLKDWLFGPKRAEFVEFREVNDIEHRNIIYRIQNLEGKMGVTLREQRKEEDAEEMQAAIAEATKLLQEGKAPAEIARTLLVTHPTVALKLAKQFGIKL